MAAHLALTDSDHYMIPIQPVEYIRANKLDFFEGNVVKYITRHRVKGGHKDLLKAKHYIDMIIVAEYGSKSDSLAWEDEHRAT